MLPEIYQEKGVPELLGKMKKIISDIRGVQTPKTKSWSGDWRKPVQEETASSPQESGNDDNPRRRNIFEKNFLRKKNSIPRRNSKNRRKIFSKNRFELFPALLNFLELPKYAKWIGFGILSCLPVVNFEIEPRWVRASMNSSGYHESLYF